MVISYLKLAAVAGVLALSFGAGWSANGWRLGAQIAALKQKNAEQIAENHKTVAMWSAHVIKLGEDANAEAERLRAAAARADAAARSLHDTSRSTAAAAASAPGTSEAAAAAIMVRERLFREADEAAGILARALGEARAAGIACQRFDEVTR